MSKSVNAKSILMFAAVMLILAGFFHPASVAAAQQGFQADPEQLGRITSFLQVMEKYIQVTKEFYGMASDEERAAAFAIMEIKTVYEQSGNRRGAIKELTGLLNETNNRTIRNIIRFQLLDLYKESNDTPAAMENLRSIIQENLQ